MDALFLKLLNMSITATWIALAVMVARLLFKKAPKAIIVSMWALVGLRLALPFSFESVLSLIPSAQPVPEDIGMMAVPQIQTGIPVINSVVNPALQENFAPNPATSANPLQILTAVAAQVWLLGVIVMALYAIISYLRLRLQVREAVRIEGKIWECDRVPSPFILGVFAPKIFLPSDMDEEDRSYVIAHEQAHLRRRDHLWKPIGYLLLTVYWFNPVLWLAYILLCRDIELACDEKVIRDMGEESKKPYSQALINCSVQKRRIAACPLAFGEGSIKGRIKSVLSYKKPTFWVILAALLACVVLAVCFLANPPEESDLPVTTHENIVASSGGQEVALISLPQEAQLEDFPEKVNWLTISPDPEDYTPFTLLVDGEMRIGIYTVYDAATYTVLPYFLPSGLEPQTYLFQNAQPGGKYIVQVKLYNDVDSRILAFGAIIPETKTEVQQDPAYASGTVFFFKEATETFNTPEITSYSALSTYEMTEVLQILENSRWVDHTGSDTVFAFDGKIYHEGWIYFSYAQNTVYYDHYYCPLDGQTKQWLQALQSVATPYDGTVRNDPVKNSAISKAILAHYQPDNPDEVYCGESFVLLGEESEKDTYTAYIVASHVAYRVNGSGERVENVAPASLTFRIVNGSYVLQNYTAVDMETHSSHIEKVFPAEIAEKLKHMDFDAYKMRLTNACHTRYNAASSSWYGILTKYPEYYGLDASEGLTVCAWQLAPGEYRWGLLEGLGEPDPLKLIHMKSTTLVELQYIVTSYSAFYGLNMQKIRVVPVRMPWSSYYYVIDEDMRQQVQRLFWSGMFTEESPYFNAVTQSVAYDSDNNGKAEHWQLRIGISAEANAYDAVIAVYEDGWLKCYNHFADGGRLVDGTFQIREDGSLCLCTDGVGGQEQIGVSMKDGNVVLTRKDGTQIPYADTQSTGETPAVIGDPNYLWKNCDDWGLLMDVAYTGDGDVTLVLNRYAYAGQTDAYQISTPPQYELEIYHEGRYLPYRLYAEDVLEKDIPEPAWDDILYTVEPGGVLRQKTYLVSTWGNLPGGMYRITKKVTRTGADNVQNTRVYTVTFPLAEATQNKPQISGEGFREWMDAFIEQRKAADGPYRCEPNEDPVAVVRSYIEKQKDAEHTISISFVKGEVDTEETRRAVTMYDGSQLAASNCWSSAWMAEHFTVVYAEYDAEFDHEKTFLPDGARAQHFYLIRDPDSMLWYIWDAMASAER